MAKIKLKYINGALPKDVSKTFANADEQDLRILSILLMAADANGEVANDFSIEEVLGISAETVNASLKFWRGAGIIGASRSTKKKSEDEDGEKENLPSAKVVIPTAHRNGALESGEVENYKSAELVNLLEKRTVTASFIDEAQKVFGKTFNSHDTNIVVGLIDQYGFEEEAILAILAYVLRLGKRAVKYAEKVAIGLYDEGYTAAIEVVARINEIEQSKEIIYKIKQMFGFGARELTKTEREMFTRWTHLYGYDMDIIRYAYDITVNSIQKPVPKYTDKILEKWYSEGLRALADIESYEANKKGASAQSQSPQKSYEIDDFFEAALKRSHKDLK